MTDQPQDPRTSGEPHTPGEPQRTTEPTLAEDLLLLLFQPDSGTIAGETTLFYPLAGAVVTQLALEKNIRTREGTGSDARVFAEAENPPTDDLLRGAWDYVSTKPRGVQTVLAAIGPTLREPLLNRLIARGEILRESRKALGIFPTTVLVEGTTGRRQQLLTDVRKVLVERAEPTARSAALAALLSGSGTLPQFGPEIPWSGPVIARAKELEQGDWGAGAAAEAVTRTITAIIVNSVAVAAAMSARRS